MVVTDSAIKIVKTSNLKLFDMSDEKSYITDFACELYYVSGSLDDNGSYLLSCCLDPDDYDVEQYTSYYEGDCNNPEHLTYLIRCTFDSQNIKMVCAN